MTDAVIVVALDGGPYGSAVLPYAQALARITGQPLRLLSVVEREPRGISPAAERIAEQREQEARTHLQEVVAETAAAVRGHGITVRTTIVLGDPVDEILAEVEQPEVGLVALSTQGRGGLDRWVVGSVADKVMRLSPKPVLLVRPPYIPLPQRTVTVRTVLVPLDGSNVAEEALPLAQRLVAATGTLRLVRVEPWRTEGVAPLGTVPEFTAMEAEAAGVAEDYLAGAVTRLAPHATVETTVLRGRPAPSLVDFALHEHIDLVVMTTHGAGGLRRLLLGSTADFLVRSGVPTLLVRPDAEPDRP